MIEKFENLSIEARFVYSICCFESAIEHFNLQHLEWSLILDKLWDFISCEYIDVWSFEVLDYMFMEEEMNLPTAPFYKVYKKLPVPPHQGNYFNYLNDVDIFNRLSKLYYHSNLIILDLLALVYEVVGEEIAIAGSYREDNSPLSLKHLKYIFDFMEKHSIPHPKNINWECLCTHTVKDSYHYLRPHKEKIPSSILRRENIYR